LLTSKFFAVGLSTVREKSDLANSPAPTDLGGRSDRYSWVVLSNTTLSMLMATIDGTIVIIAMPAIFRGIHLDPTAPGNIGYLLWMIIGYLLVTAVVVVTLGRLGDMYGRVKIYNLGFVVFTLASIALSLDPLQGGHGALWLILWRMVQAFGGSMLMANAAAILTDAFPANKRGMALGVNQIVGISGQFIGLLLGGVLAAIDWRLIFWVNVPIGVFGTIWSYKKLHEVPGARHKAGLDWWGNLTFAAGVSWLLIGITYGIQPYGGHATGWTSPLVISGLIGGPAVLVVFCIIESRVAEPMFRLALFKIRAFSAGNAASLLGSVARGGLQFMLIFWLQAIWLPLHGYAFADTPLWAGIYMLPLTAGFLIAGPISGILSDKYGQRIFATGGLLVGAAAFTGLMVLPIDFHYWVFATIIFFNGVGSGLFASPNVSAIMSSVPAEHRGAASGMRSTFQNAGQSLSIGIFFSLLIAGLAATLPQTLYAGLRAKGVSAAVATHVAHLPPVGTLFASFLGYNPLQALLKPYGVLPKLSAANRDALTSKKFFPELVSQPFHHGLVIVFSAAIAMSLAAAAISLLRGKQFIYDDAAPPAAPVHVVADGVAEAISVAAVAEDAMAEADAADAPGETPPLPVAGGGGAGTDRRPGVPARRQLDDTDA
jgi:MFS family permease